MTDTILLNAQEAQKFLQLSNYRIFRYYIKKYNIKYYIKQKKQCLYKKKDLIRIKILIEKNKSYKKQGKCLCDIYATYSLQENTKLINSILNEIFSSISQTIRQDMAIKKINISTLARKTKIPHTKFSKILTGRQNLDIYMCILFGEVLQDIPLFYINKFLEECKNRELLNHV